MKELKGSARNFSLVYADGDKYIPAVEIVLVLTEPQYTFSEGKMLQERVPETMRFSTSQEGVKNLIKVLMECDEELERLNKLAGVINQTTPIERAGE